MPQGSECLRMRRQHRAAVENRAVEETVRPEREASPGGGDGLGPPEGALARSEPVASAGGRLSLGPDRFFDGAVFDSAPSETPTG